MASTALRTRRKLQEVPTPAPDPCCPCPTPAPTKAPLEPVGGGGRTRRLQDDVCPSCACAEAVTEEAGQEKLSMEGDDDGNDATTSLIVGILALFACVVLVLGIAAIIAITVLAPHARKQLIKTTTMTAIDPVGNLLFDETFVPIGTAISGPTSSSAKHCASPAGLAAMHWRSAIASPKPRGRRSSFTAEMNPLAAAQAARGMMIAKESKASEMTSNPMDGQDGSRRALGQHACGVLRAGGKSALRRQPSGIFAKTLQSKRGRKSTAGRRKSASDFFAEDEDPMGQTAPDAAVVPSQGGALSRLRRAGKHVVARNKVSAAEGAAADQANPMRPKKRRGSTFGAKLRRASFGAMNPIAVARKAARDAADAAHVPDDEGASLSRVRRVSFVQQNPYAVALAAQEALREMALKSADGSDGAAEEATLKGLQKASPGSIRASHARLI